MKFFLSLLAMISTLVSCASQTQAEQQTSDKFLKPPKKSKKIIIKQETSRNLNNPSSKQITKNMALDKKALLSALTTINPKRLNPQAAKQAVDFYFQNHIKHKLSGRYLAIADFSKPSNQKRLAVINLSNGKTEFYKVAHGQGSDPNHDLIFDQFSSKPGSYATPAGFHKATTTYYGKHGLSLKLQGLEERNKTSMRRAVVLHGAKYVSWKHTGRSQGCPSVEMKYRNKLVDQLKGGALFYHFR